VTLSAGGTVVNAGSISGGAGGAYGTGGFLGAAGGTGSGGASGCIPNTTLIGVGGTGIAGANLTVINSGTISGGDGYFGQANAITSPAAATCSNCRPARPSPAMSSIRPATARSGLAA
jgi:hypothetical protein